MPTRSIDGMKIDDITIADFAIADIAGVLIRIVKPKPPPPVH